MLWWKCFNIEYKKCWNQGGQWSRKSACVGKGDNALHDFSIFTGFSHILLPQICIFIPNLYPGVWFLVCPLLQNYIITSGEDGMVNTKKDQIVTFLVRILAAVQNRIKLQKVHKTWSCREQSNHIWKNELLINCVCIYSCISHPFQMPANVKDNITDSRYH